MPAFDTLHNELRMRVPNKPYEFYNDAIRWAIDHICRKTSLWRVTTIITTEADKDIYDLDLPVNSVIHSNLYIIQKGNTDRVIRRPINGFVVNQSGAPSDWLQAFKTIGQNQIQLFPMPKDGGEELHVVTAVKPTSSAIGVNNDKLFDEYKDTVVYGALFRCHEADGGLDGAGYNETKFKEGVSSIHVDVLKENADTPMKVSAAW